MRFYNIEKKGIKNVIDEVQFEKIYRPQGWHIVSDAETGELIKDPHEEEKIKNVNKMKKVKDDKFDDDLFKKENNGKV